MTAFLKLRSAVEPCHRHKTRNQYKGVDDEPADTEQAGAQQHRNHREYQPGDPIRIEQAEWTENQAQHELDDV